MATIRYIVRAGRKGGRHIASTYDTAREAVDTARDHAWLLGLEAGASWFKVDASHPRSGLENGEVWVEVERIDGTTLNLTGRVG